MVLNERPINLFPHQINLRLGMSDQLIKRSKYIVCYVNCWFIVSDNYVVVVVAVVDGGGGGGAIITSNNSW